MFVSVLFFPVAAAVGAHSAGAGWFTALFVPFGLAIGCAVAYAGRKLIYGVLGFAMKTPKGWMQHVVSVPVMILYIILPYAIVWIGVLDTWYGSIWLVKHIF